jgi:type I restriction enzyme S subunit
VTDPIRVIRYGILMPGPDRKEGPLYVKVKNMKGGRIHVESLQRTTPEIFAKFAGAALEPGDLLMSIRGSYGGVALVPDEIAGANITQDSARIAPMPEVNRLYLLHMLRSPVCQRFFARVAKGAAVQGVNIGDLRRTPIALPPLPEQNRIVAKVEHLMKLCDDLEAKLRLAEDRASKLVEAVVQELVA